MATLGDMTRETTYCFKLNKRVKDTGFVFTVSLKNINQLTATRIKGKPTGGGTCPTISCVSTVLAPGIEQQNADELLLARGTMGSTIV